MLSLSLTVIFNVTMSIKKKTTQSQGRTRGRSSSGPTTDTHVQGATEAAEAVTHAVQELRDTPEAEGVNLGDWVFTKVYRHGRKLPGPERTLPRAYVGRNDAKRRETNGY